MVLTRTLGDKKLHQCKQQHEDSDRYVKSPRSLSAPLRIGLYQRKDLTDCVYSGVPKYPFCIVARPLNSTGKVE